LKKALAFLTLVLTLALPAGAQSLRPASGSSSSASSAPSWVNAGWVQPRQRSGTLIMEETGTSGAETAWAGAGSRTFTTTGGRAGALLTTSVNQNFHDNWSSSSEFFAAEKPDVTFWFRTGASNTSVIYEIGLSATTAAQTDNVHKAVLRSTDMGVWTAITSNGTAGSTASLISPAADTETTIRIKFTDASTCEFWVNGALAATRIATMPTGAMRLVVTIQNTGASDDSIIVRRIYWTGPA
jgi:hypothetical protein